MANNQKHYDWKQIQKEYDEGLSQPGIIAKYGMSASTIVKAVRRGDLKSRDKAAGIELHWETKKAAENDTCPCDERVYYPINEWHEIIHMQNRRVDHIYDIGTGMTHSYQFNVRPNSILTIETVHDYKGAQDFSIIAWFSSHPIDPIMYSGSQYAGFNLCRSMIAVKFSDLYTKNRVQKTLKMQPCTSFWINFKNNQVLPNQFYLKFSY